MLAEESGQALGQRAGILDLQQVGGAPAAPSRFINRRQCAACSRTLTGPAM